MSGPRRLIAASGWNLVGQGLPLGVAVVSIPALIHLIGLERFGFIALAWVLIGYASLFDMGMGRAVIRTVSARLAQGDAPGALASGRTGLSLLVAFGLLTGGLTLAFAPALVAHVLVVPPALQLEAERALRLLALSLPVVMLTSGYVGVLSAHQAFRTLNLVRAFFSVLAYLLPLAVAAAGWVSLPAVVGTIVLLRVAGAVAYAVACRREAGFDWRLQRPDRQRARELLALGGWMSVSNLLGPLLGHLDRLLIGALVPLRSVGIYSAPYDLVTRLMIIPYALVAALFPVASALKPGTPQVDRALRDITRYLFLIMFPVMLLVMALANPAMRLWLGPEIGEQAGEVLHILVVGVFLNTLAQGPATLIQAAGRPRDMALLHLLELPLFLAVLWALTARWGINGTAAAATLRFAIDALAVFVLAQRSLKTPPLPWRRALGPALAAVSLMALAQACRSWPEALGLAVGGGGLFLAYGWRSLLQPRERSRIEALWWARWRRPVG